MNRPRTLALIPARGGSRRLPGKNLATLAGRPLIRWTINAALSARSVDDVVVSTDDPAIAEVAEAAGAEVPFLRPKDIATDHSSTEEVMRHALQTLAEAGRTWDLLVLLQPTSPLRTSADIDEAVTLFRERQASAVISVCTTDHPPEWCNPLPPDRSLAGFLRPDVVGKRSQDLPTSYRLNGAIYIYPCRAVLEGAIAAFTQGSYAYVMPRERSIDIDEPIDLVIAGALLEQQEGSA